MPSTQLKPVQTQRGIAAAARDSADSAKRMLTVTHRPRLVAHPIEIDGFSRRHITDRLTNGQTWITNTGVLDAQLQKFWCEWLFADGLPLVNPAHSSEEGNVALIPIPPGHFVKIPIPDYDVPFEAIHAINNMVDSIAPPKGDLYLIGCTKYRDEIGLIRDYFAYRYDPTVGRFETVDHPNYTYRK